MSETLTETKTRLETFIKEVNAEADISPGSALSELVVKLAATLHNPIKNDIDSLSTGVNIEAALASTEDTYNPIIDGIASNYNLVRGTGRKSTGKIKIQVSSNINVYIREAAVFTQPVLGLNYVVTQSYLATVNPTGDELPLYSNNGVFYFYLPVEAENAGAEYQLTDQAVLTPSEFTIPFFIDAKAYGNFSSGLAQETDKELISRLHTGLSNKTLLTDASIRSRLADLYPEFQTLSIITANDEEMTRSKQNLFGISSLGMVDVYVRTAKGAQTQIVTKQATQSGSTWTVEIDHNDIGGFYKALAITPSGTDEYGTLEFTQSFSYSLSGLDKTNNVTNTTEARFSKYQTCTLTFEYTNTTFTGLVDIMFLTQPYITEIQDLFLADAERIACADYLVKAVVPCFTSVELKIKKKKASDVVPVEDIKKDIFSYINSRNFGEKVTVSEIIKICHQYSIDYVVLPVKLTGQIYSQKGTVINISSNTELEIPSRITSGVSKKTTLFITDYFKTTTGNALTDSISISVE